MLSPIEFSTSFTQPLTQPVVQQCIQACLTCHTECLQAVVHCLGRDDVHADVEQVRLLNSCAELSQTCAHLLLMGSQFYPRICELTAEICEIGAERCEQMGEDDSMMQACAVACRKCAFSCKEISLVMVNDSQ